MPLADYFTGYRASVRQHGELIKEVVVPLPLAPLTAFHKIAKRRYDDISSVAVGFALDVGDGVVRSRADRARRRRRHPDPGARRPRPPWSAGRGPRRPSTRRPTVLAAEGTPIDDQRAIGPLPVGDARPVAAPALRRDRRGGDRMSDLSQRPDGAVVGETMPHESAALHVTGRALYTDDLTPRTKDVLHAWPVQAPHAHARVTGLRVDAAYDEPGVVRVLTADDVPGVNDSGIKHDEPLFPTEVMHHGQAVCWVLGETLEAARRGAGRGRGRLRAAARAADDPRGDRGRELPGRSARSGTRRRRRRDWLGPPTSSRARSRWPGRSTSTWRRRPRWPRSTTAARSSCSRRTQHPTETQEVVAHVLGLASHAVTVQCLRMGGGFGGKEMQANRYAAVAALGATLTGRPVRVRLTRTQDMTLTGKRHGFHATWRVGFDDDGRLLGARRHPHLRRRLEPRPLRAGAGPGDLPRRQRLLDPRRRASTAASRRPTRRRRPPSAASAGRRGCW